MELLNVHFSFFCRKKRTNTKGQSPIVLRVIYRQERRDLFTGLYCNSVDWDSDAGKLFLSGKQAETINKNLELINYQALQAFDQLKFSGNTFTLDELVNKLKGREEKPTSLIEHLKARNKELSLRAGVDITQTTYEKYERSLRYMIDFLEVKYKVKNYIGDLLFNLSHFAYGCDNFQCSKRPGFVLSPDTHPGNGVDNIYSFTNFIILFPESDFTDTI